MFNYLPRRSNIQTNSKSDILLIYNKSKPKKEENKYKHNKKRTDCPSIILQLVYYSILYITVIMCLVMTT